MPFIEILRDTGVAAGIVQAGPAGGFVSRAAKQLPVDEAFHPDDGVVPASQPILGEPGTAQGQGTGGQIGQLMRVGQNAEAGVVGPEMPAAGQLFLGPADPSLTRAQVPGWGAPTQQGQPLALVLSHVAEMFADQSGVLEIMMGGD